VIPVQPVIDQLRRVGTVVGVRYGKLLLAGTSGVDEHVDTDRVGDERHTKCIRLVGGEKFEPLQERFALAHSWHVACLNVTMPDLPTQSPRRLKKAPLPRSGVDRDGRQIVGYVSLVAVIVVRSSTVTDGRASPSRFGVAVASGRTS
jgi:hypothetical protein